MKEFLIILIIVSLVVYHPQIIRAHEITKDPWIYINDQILEENETEKPYHLVWPSHVLENSFKTGEDIKVKIQQSTIFEAFSASSITAEWQSELAAKTDSDKVTLNSNSISINDDKIYLFKGLEFTLNYAKTGSYIVFVTIYDQNDKKIIDESLGINVGDPIQPSNFQVNGVKSDQAEAMVSRIELTALNVISPDNSKYRYQWDLLDGVIKEGAIVSKNFIDSNLPAYVVLRTIDKTTNIYSDSYLRVDSADPPRFKVYTPPIEEYKGTNGSDNSNIILISLGGGFLLLVAVILTLRRKSAKITK